MSLKEIVNVQISREIPGVTRVGFGTPLYIIEKEIGTTPRVSSYSTAESVAEVFGVDSVAHKMALATFSQDVAPTLLKIGIRDMTATAETYAEALQAIFDYDNDWYGLGIQSRVKADILAVAAIIEAQDNKIFGAVSADAGIKDQATTDDVMSELRDLSHARTFLIYHSSGATVYPECAWFGIMLPQDPGSATWKFKTLAGIPVDSLTTNEKTVLLNKGANFYERIAGVAITREGVMAESNTTFIDIIHGVDWLRQRMMERIFARLTTAPKIPYTNAGIAIIESLIRAQLNQGIERGVIAPEPEYTITVPDVLATDELDRADRILRDVKFSARLAGAIHTLLINGVVTI